MKVLTLILAAMLDMVPAGQAFLKPLQPRDSILIADQLEYGFQLDSLAEGTPVALPDFSGASNDTLTLVRSWQIDTTARLHVRQPGGKGRAKLYSIRGSIVLAPFEEGLYHLPPIPVLRGTDTLLFEGLDMEVKTMPVDTATFQIHDIKGQMRYPLTFREVLPWIVGVCLLAALVILAVCLVLQHRRRAAGADKPKDPAYIVALRELDKWRGDKFWAPDKQKAYYSGITDALKNYIEDRFGVDAPEMTTAELFESLKLQAEDLPADLREELREVFECADFVKFAKHTASQEENARALPTAVRFVTSTYQTVLEEEQKNEHEL